MKTRMKTRITFCGLMSALLLLVAGTAGAQENLIYNGSFENPVAPPTGVLPPTGWTGSSGIFVAGFVGVPGVVGNQVVFFQASGTPFLSQSVSTTAGVEHNLSFAYGKGGDYWRTTRIGVQVYLASNLTTPIAQTGLLNPGTSPVGTDHTDLFPASLTFTPTEGDIVVKFVQAPPQTRVFPILDNVVLTVANAPPTADAGPDQSIHASDTVLLDGSDSFDDNTLPEDLDYQWSFDSKPTGSTATFDNATSQTPSFVADKAGTYTISLVVYDDEGLPSVADTVDISSSNLAPTAVATVDYSLAIIGQPVTFDGSGSTDPDGDEVFYDWVIDAAPAGSTAALVGGNTPMPTLTPDVEGVYIVTLEVSDFLGPGTSPAIVEITATTASGYAEIQIVDAFDQVAALTGAQVTTQGNQQAFSNFLTAATQNVQQGKVSQAIAKLNQAIQRTDGCALRGSPDGNGPGMDWITDCGEQDAIYDLLTAALNALQN